ncbi:methenyltetrahydrofolate synthase domain-containing protein [Microplitis demolitor]|uniref:methenyltetrahydrofolate synthase domain-containing protein n=1 Tax=Microplitis demolitor TaxID=69319 RepID=UPI0004CD4599|nr:methenyltetrahydrofolate synthase domain-containing protein [Microplitis demolitor]
MSKEQTAGSMSKHNYRDKIWNYMMDNDLVNFPSIVYHRIPNFKGADEAARRLSELDEFKNARVMKVNPDKPQEPVRLSALEAGKEILVPIPRLKTGLFLHVVPTTPAGTIASRDDLKVMATRHGIQEHGKPISVDSDIKVDLVVLGSVCVSRDGYRIGKGEGFADLEFAMMMRMNAVSDETVVVTTVHDCQLIDKFEDGLFEKHDVPVDIIITPTQTIFVNEKLKKPVGIFWDILTPRRVKAMQILQLLKKIDEKEGKQVILKKEDPNNDNVKPKRFEKNWKRTKGKKNSKVKEESASELKLKSDNNGNDNNSPKENGDSEVKEEKKEKPKNPRRRQPPKNKKIETDAPNETEKIVKPKDPDVRRKAMKLKSKPHIDFSLKLSNIGSDVRVRDLKNALSQRGVNPTSITWRGQRGFCYLHFGKLRNKNSQPNQPVQVDSIVSNLQQLYVGDANSNGNGSGGDSNITNDKFIIVEPAKPITRIETTDVTAV